jgi:hypothetical protein
MSQLLDLIRGLGAPFNMIATICLIFALVAAVGAIATMVGAIAKEIRKFASHRQELEFKRELLERGMTVEEVERLVEQGKERE